MSWVLPNALENRDAMSTAWYMPTPLSPYSSSRPELEDEEDEAGMKSSMTYLVSLIDDLVEKGVPEKRIVLGGFLARLCDDAAYWLDFFKVCWQAGWFGRVVRISASGG